MSKCPACGANFPDTSFVCEYCGHVVTENIKEIKSDGSKKVSFSEQMSVIEDNLNALYEIHPPSISATISRVFRIVVAIQTMGFALLFWKKPKNKFDETGYKKLKAIVRRNILKLKMLSLGNAQLLGQISIVEDELTKIDNEISKGMRSKQITIIVIVAFYLAIIFLPRFA